MARCEGNPIKFCYLRSYTPSQRKTYMPTRWMGDQCNKIFPFTQVGFSHCPIPHPHPSHIGTHQAWQNIILRNVFSRVEKSTMECVELGRAQYYGTHQALSSGIICNDTAKRPLALRDNWGSPRLIPKHNCCPGSLMHNITLVVHSHHKRIWQNRKWNQMMTTCLPSERSLKKYPKSISRKTFQFQS